MEPIIFLVFIFFKNFFLNFCKFCKSRWDSGDGDSHGHGEKILTGHFAENEMA